MSYEKLKKLEEKVSEAAKILDKLRKEKAAFESRFNELQNELSTKEAELRAIRSQTDQFEPVIEALIKKLDGLSDGSAPLETKRAEAGKPAPKGKEPKAVGRASAQDQVAEYQAHFDLGNVYEEKGMYEEAINEYRKALAVNPDYVEAVEHLAFLLEKLNRENEAMPLWEKVMALKKPR